MKILFSIFALASLATGHGAHIRYLGRVNPSTKELTWPGTGLAFSFTGTIATICLTAKGTNSVDLIIDGLAPTVIPNVEGNTISSPVLAPGNHSVILLKRSEALYGSLFIGNVTINGTLTASPASRRQIEIIGDSITVGYGLDGTPPCTNTAAVENNPLTYGALAANALKAEYNIVAWSGKGLIRNYVTGSVDTSPIMPQLYTRYGANDADGSYTFPTSWSPAVVVVNLGTNDFSYLGYTSNGTAYAARPPLNATVYADAMVSFVRNIQTHYPAAEIFLLTSPMLSDSWPTAADAQKSTQSAALRAVVDRVGRKAHLVEWPTQGSVTGCDSHPDAGTHAVGAKILEQAVGKVMGW